jgi:AraC-like DNA-binding protein
MYEDSLSSASMIAAMQPFKINISPVYVDRPWPMHWHDAYEVNYVLRGSGIFVIENQEIPFHRHHVHVINGISRHMLYAQEDSLIFNVHFHPALLSDASFRTLQDIAERPFSSTIQHFAPALPSENPHTDEIVGLLRAIEAEHGAAADGWPLIVKGLILQIIGLLVRHFLADSDPDIAALHRREILSRLTPALQLIELRLENPPALEELARVVNLSPSHFSALFRQATGTSPVTYRNARRIAIAQQLLLGSDEPVARIAERSGFATLQQFNLVFRRLIGCTPSAYRNRTNGEDETDPQS